MYKYNCDTHDTIAVTADNIDDLPDDLPLDIRDEVIPGCLIRQVRLWDEDNQRLGRRVICLWPDVQRVAICDGVDHALWGDYTAGDAADVPSSILMDDGTEGDGHGDCAG